MSVRLSCPSCNTSFTLDAIPSDGRATCPRCGDVFPIRGDVLEQANRDREEAGGAPPAATKLETRTAKPKRGLSIPRAVMIALAMGLIGLAVGLVVYYSRPKMQPTPQPEPPVANANATAPKELVGLGYLPAECNVTFAVQPGPLVVYAERTKQDPRTVLRQLGIPQQAISAIDALGLPLTEIDHITGGAFLGKEGDDLRVAIVIVLKQPVADEGEFLRRLKAKPVPKKDARWSVELDNSPLAPRVARASPTVWVFGLNEGDFSAVGKNHGPGGVQFKGNDTEGMRKMIASLPPDAAVWIATDDEGDWAQKPLVKFALQNAEARKWAPAVPGARGGSVAISFGESPRLKLQARAADAETAARVRTYFQARAAEIESAKVAEPAGETFAAFETPFDPATSWAMLQRFLEDARN